MVQTRKGESRDVEEGLANKSSKFDTNGDRGERAGYKNSGLIQITCHDVAAHWSRRFVTGICDKAEIVAGCVDSGNAGLNGRMSESE